MPCSTQCGSLWGSNCDRFEGSSSPTLGYNFHHRVSDCRAGVLQKRCLHTTGEQLFKCLVGDLRGFQMALGALVLHDWLHLGALVESCCPCWLPFCLNVDACGLRVSACGLSFGQVARSVEPCAARDVIARFVFLFMMLHNCWSSFGPFLAHFCSAVLTSFSK